MHLFMYTLRLFKESKSEQRTQIYLGDTYTIEPPSEEEFKEGVRMRVYGNWDGTTKEGFSIFNNQYAYIMTSRGETFETLNRPKSES